MNVQGHYGGVLTFRGKLIFWTHASIQYQHSLHFSFPLLQVLLTCPWSEQPPTEAPVVEEEEEEEERLFKEEEEEVEVVEYEVVKEEEEEEDMWTKSMDEWAERQRSCAIKSTQNCLFFRVLIVVTLYCALK